MNINILRNPSGIYDNKRIELELQRKELQRQLDEVDQHMKFAEIDSHKNMLTALDHFDNKRQPQLLSALTDVGQPDRICPLCEKYFSSTTELPHWEKIIVIYILFNGVAFRVYVQDCMTSSSV